MNFEIVQKEPFKVVAKVRPFEMNNDGTEIPKFWDEYLSDGSDEKVMGMFGICLPMETSQTQFNYAIGCLASLIDEIPEGFEIVEIPAQSWAVFKCIGAMPHAIQNKWKEIHTEGLPSSEYELSHGYEVEHYSAGDASKDDYESEIWVPVKLKLIPETSTEDISAEETLTEDIPKVDVSDIDSSTLDDINSPTKKKTRKWGLILIAALILFVGIVFTLNVLNLIDPVMANVIEINVLDYNPVDKEAPMLSGEIEFQKFTLGYSDRDFVTIDGEEYVARTRTVQFMTSLNTIREYFYVDDQQGLMRAAVVELGDQEHNDADTKIEDIHVVTMPLKMKIGKSYDYDYEDQGATRVTLLKFDELKTKNKTFKNVARVEWIYLSNGVPYYREVISYAKNIGMVKLEGYSIHDHNHTEAEGHDNEDWELDMFIEYDGF